MPGNRSSGTSFPPRLRRGQRQHLVERLGMGDERGSDELPASGTDLVGAEREQPPERSVRVITQAVFIAHRDEHQIQSPGLGVGATEMMVAHQTVVDPAKMRRDAPHTFRTEEVFFDHGFLGWAPKEPAHALSAGASLRPYPLVTPNRSVAR